MSPNLQGERAASPSPPPDPLSLVLQLVTALLIEFGKSWVWRPDLRSRLLRTGLSAAQADAAITAAIDGGALTILPGSKTKLQLADSAAPMAVTEDPDDPGAKTGAPTNAEIPPATPTAPDPVHFARGLIVTLASPGLVSTMTTCSALEEALTLAVAAGLLSLGEGCDADAARQRAWEVCSSALVEAGEPPSEDIEDHIRTQLFNAWAFGWHPDELPTGPALVRGQLTAEQVLWVGGLAHLVPLDNPVRNAFRSGDVEAGMRLLRKLEDELVDGLPTRLDEEA